MTTWKPGDVAIACVRGCQGVLVVVASDPPKATDDVVFVSERRVHGEHRHNIRLCNDIRPLAVIDPESAEDVKRLAGALGNQDWTLGPKGVADLAAALREFAAPTPPKPAEPTGLGAVVEDADGLRYVRTEAGDTTRIPWYCPDHEDLDGHWDDVPAVRVLFEGVTP